MTTFIEQFTSSPEGMRLFHQERATLELTELIIDVMERHGISRAELARRMKRTRPYVTQLLSGKANMTVKTASDMFVAIGRALHFSDGSIEVCGREHHAANTIVPASLPTTGNARIVKFSSEVG